LVTQHNETAQQAHLRAGHTHPFQPRRPKKMIVNMIMHVAAQHRNKRCVLAYLVHRLDKLRQVWWANGGVQLSDPVRALLSPSELSFHSGYDSLLSAYMVESKLMLQQDLLPPKDPLVEVCVANPAFAGDIMTEQGPVQLTRKSVHLLRRTDVEMLIRQGELKQTQQA